MTHWSEEKFQEVQQRMNITQESISKSEARRLAIQIQDEPESTLSKNIRQWAKDKGYPALVLRQSIKARGLITPGWPDVTLALPKGKTLYLELKRAKGGTLKDNQKLIAQELLTLKHLWFQVKTWKAFLEIVNDPRPMSSL